MHVVIAFLLGTAVGLFCPSLARKLHARLSEESKKGCQFAEVVFKDVEKHI